MNERFKLNSGLVRTYLEKEGRKNSYLASELKVSGALVALMLCEGHVPKQRTLEKLAKLLKVPEQQLLIPREAA